jgi:Flp pilus assembly protein TadD
MIGQARRLSGDYRGAVEACSKAIEVVPEEAFAWTVRARARVALGDFDGARSDLSRALTLDPKSAAVWVGWAELSLAEGNPGDAAAEYRYALDLGLHGPELRRVREALATLENAR